jgi:hypothetical protein
VSLFACKLTTRSEEDRVVEEGSSKLDISTSQEDYEFDYRRDAIIRGADEE